MRRTFRSMLALTAVLSARAVHAQADEVKPPAAETPRWVGIASVEAGKTSVEEKQKTQILLLMDRTRALSRWMTNETSFLAAVDRVQERLVAAKEIELAPMRDFDPYLSGLSATLARMDVRVSALQAPVEICDPSRKRDLFLLFLDTLDADGQGQVLSRICEKITSEEGSDGNVSQACTATGLGLLVARSMHDFIVSCEPSLAGADAGGARFDRLSLQLAGVQASVQDSVRSSKVELTQAMSMVMGHVAETSSTNTKQLEDLTVRLEIERALQQGSPYGSLYLPQANGGRLEVVRAIVGETIQHVLDSGESANQASTKLAAGDDELKNGHFKQAFRFYSEAYKAAVALPSRPRP